MRYLAWIITATIICGFDAAPLQKDFGTEDKEIFPKLYDVQKYTKENLDRHDVAPITALKSFPKTELAAKVEHQLIDLSEQAQTKIADGDSDFLRFSEKRGRMVTLSGNGRTATRVNEFGEPKVFAITYTTRPLEDDELFEIRILEEDAEAGDNYNLTIGLTTANPEQIEHLPMIALYINSPGWFLYGTEGRQCNGECRRIHGVNLPRRGKVNDTLGVMRKSSGDINFYFNKKFIGSITTLFPGEVYGVVDLRNNVDKIKITS
ncbi:neuralized-like protein 4 [Ischnura elegans]|uniref:neuralized-like protein 4 n=1 Tax=Ischnura elegans TaxID=197161 RepID=UPI001ED872FE|nr:neuralized-like protein 4 [Ischnura elegans]